MDRKLQIDRQWICYNCIWGVKSQTVAGGCYVVLCTKNNINVNACVLCFIKVKKYCHSSSLNTFIKIPYISDPVFRPTSNKHWASEDDACLVLDPICSNSSHKVIGSQNDPSQLGGNSSTTFFFKLIRNVCLVQAICHICLTWTIVSVLIILMVWIEGFHHVCLTLARACLLQCIKQHFLPWHWGPSVFCLFVCFFKKKLKWKN